jgi:hypothetical protein
VGDVEDFLLVGDVLSDATVLLLGFFLGLDFELLMLGFYCFLVSDFSAGDFWVGYGCGYRA